MQIGSSGQPRRSARRVLGRVGCGALELAAIWAGAGCVARQPASSSETAPATAHQAFGGERAAFGETASGASVGQGAGRCQNVPAISTDPLIADFEQDSVFVRPVPQRWGTWYMGNDGSPDGKQEPDSFAAERGGYGGSNYAVHFKVRGFSEWGAVLGATLRYAPEDGIRCPYNASGFDGLSFMARGKGRIRVNVNTPDTVPTDLEGRCKKSCWDSHGAYVFLNDEWTEHRLPWSAFAQQGWGTIARLNLNEILSINFAIGRADQPAELWLDDLKFIPKGAGAGAGK
jgi:hypothetical protein